MFEHEAQEELELIWEFKEETAWWMEAMIVCGLYLESTLKYTEFTGVKVIWIWSRGLYV